VRKADGNQPAMNIEPSVPGNTNCSRQARSSRISTSFPTGARRWVRSVWVSKKNLYMFPTIVERLPFLLHANFAMTRECTASDLLGPIHRYIVNILSKKMTAACRNWEKPLRQFDWLQIFGISSSTSLTVGASDDVVVKALRYQPAGRGFDSRWCHWNFSVT
jgi:hypothetical protein